MVWFGVELKKIYYKCTVKILTKLSLTYCGILNGVRHQIEHFNPVNFIWSGIKKKKKITVTFLINFDELLFSFEFWISNFPSLSDLLINLPFGIGEWDKLISYDGYSLP